MRGFNLRNGEYFCDDISLNDLAEKYGTPCYVYSNSILKRQANALLNALATHWQGSHKPQAAFAVKANSHIAILKTLGEIGFGADVVSVGEMRRAIHAGIAANKIVFSGVGKTEAEIEEAILKGIHQFNVESVAELQLIDSISRKHKTLTRLAFRLTPEVAASTHAKIATGTSENKFGLMADEILQLADSVRDNPYIKIAGLSVHIGSQILEMEKFRAAYEAERDLIETLTERGFTPDTIDLGGGIGVPYMEGADQADLDGYAKMVNDIFKNHHDKQLVVEPGRLIVAECGALLTRVISIKERSHKKFLIVDAAMNDLIRPTLYEAYHPIFAAKPVTNRDVYDVVGPVCETGDIFAESREMPEMQTGDLAFIGFAGAYGNVMASTYNTRPHSPEILVEGKNCAVITKRKTIEDLIADENLPQW